MNIRVDLSYSCRKINFKFLAGTPPSMVPLDEKIMCVKFEIDRTTGRRASSQLKFFYFWNSFFSIVVYRSHTFLYIVKFVFFRSLTI